MKHRQPKINHNPHVCQSKRSYPRFNEAKHAAKMLHQKTDDQVHPFACSVCGGAHVGSVGDFTMLASSEDARRDDEPSIEEALFEAGIDIPRGCRIRAG
jgi:hypothetical protein